MLATSLWDLLCSVRFAVVQIALLCVAGVIGAVLDQLPTYATRDAQGYVTEMARIRAKYEAVQLLGMNVGPAMTELFESLGFFRIFSSPWFLTMLTILTLSIAVCTLNKLPKLWRDARRVRVEQPAPFFDLRLANRARLERGGVDVATVDRALRRNGFRRPSIADPGSGVVSLHGAKNQYAKLATLLTHTGLILFLAAGAVTSAMGFETVVFLGEGQSAPVQPVGTPRNLLVRNIGFDAPQRPDGSFADFWTDVAVYREGQQVARKTIRVNDPLEFEGFYFHQNTFGPAQEIEVRDAAGRLLWSGPVLLTGQAAGLPQAFFTIPGSQVGLVIVLDRDAAGTPALAVVGLGPSDEPGSNELLFTTVLGVGHATVASQSAGYSIKWLTPGSFSGMVIKRDPGAPFVWVGFVTLVGGLVLTFYFPQRRVWVRVTDQSIDLALVADRYVAADKELDSLVDDIKASNAHGARAGARMTNRIGRFWFH